MFAGYRYVASGTFCAAVWLSILASPTEGRPAASQPSQPVHRVSLLRADKSDYDFGTAWAGDTVTHTFELTNLGARLVKIRDVRLTCGCTTAEPWEKTVPPGTTWKLTVKLDTANREGKLGRTIYVVTDDPARPEVRFSLAGTIRPRFELSPAAGIAFGMLTQDSDEARTLTITRQIAAPVTITGVELDSTQFRASVRAIEEGRKYEVRVRTAPPLQPHNTRATMRIRTDLPEQPEIAVPLFAYVQPKVLLLPQVLMIPANTDQEVRRRLMVKSTDGTPLAIIGIESSCDKVQCRSEVVREQQEYRVWVTVPAGTELPAESQIVTILTNHPEYPKLTATIRPLTSLSSRGNPASETTPLAATSPSRLNSRRR